MREGRVYYFSLIIFVFLSLFLTHIFFNLKFRKIAKKNKIKTHVYANKN